MRILIITPDQPAATGNWVTARRFQAGLKQRGHEAAVVSTPLEPKTGFRAKLEQFAPDVALLLHAYRTGKPWLDSKVEQTLPIAVLLTGTDVNHGLQSAEQGPVIRRLLRRAGAVIMQNSLILHQIETEQPEFAAKLHYLPPGIILGDAPYDLRRECPADLHKRLFFCPAGLRQVKGVHDLLTLFETVAARTDRFHLVFAGPVLDKRYAKDFLAALGKRPWASYLGVIRPEAMAAAISSADVILNNSLSEGLPNSLLEASSLGVPILARDIPGNAAIVNHGVNGMLYASAEEFLRLVVDFINNPGLRDRLSRPAQDRYSAEKESDQLEKLLVTL